jgi:CRISPR-associated endonuclease/helicase Cas3
MSGIPSFYRYWGKSGLASGQDQTIHLLPYHCLDAAAVGLRFLEHSPGLSARLASIISEDPASVERLAAYFFALHDIGKFAPGFQQKLPDAASRLSGSLTPTMSSAHHTLLGAALWDHLE